MRLFQYITLAFLSLTAAAHAQPVCEGRDLMADLPADKAAAIDAAVAATPYPTGLLWNAQKDELSITVFGTYHFRHPQTEDHLTRLSALIDHADLVYLETGGQDMIEAERAMASDADLVFITKGPTLIEQMSDQEWQTYSAAMAERAIPGFMAAKFKPFFASMMLSISPCDILSGVLEEKGIDFLINARAGDRAASLEDWREMLGTINAMPNDKQIEMLRMSFAYIQQANDISYTLLQRYLDQDIARLWEYMRIASIEAGATAQDFADMEKPLVEDRNRAWAEKLSGLPPQSKVFVAVGAGHLPGKAGLLNLLAEAGFTVKQLPFAAR